MLFKKKNRAQESTYIDSIYFIYIRLTYNQHTHSTTIKRIRC